MSLNPSVEPESPDSPNNPSPPPAPPRNRLFASLRPTQPPESAPSPSSSPETTPSPSPDVETGAPIWSTAAPADPQPPEDASSGTLSIGKSGRVSKAGLRVAVGGGFRRLCRLVAVFAADDVERSVGLWIPDDDDVTDIAEPAANLIYRRVPEEARGGDVLDLFQLGLALAGYVGKQLQARAVIRTHRAMAAAAGETADPGA